MPTRIKLETTTTGPFFDSALYGRIMDRHLAAAKEEIAQLAVNRIKERIGARAKNPTGHYASRVVTDRVAPNNDQRVHDGKSRYGPWLEGKSSRNQTTRFKGYRIWRRTRSWVRKQATPIAQKQLDEFVDLMNGGHG